tara:strand:- start:583 stop:1302 length:720 start_codon:yes stop_codon:yes gene_type:complete
MDIGATEHVNPHNGKELIFYYRPESSDEKVLKEIFKKGCYRKPSIGFDVEEGETWIDLGGHIGLFALYAVSKGAKKVIVYEADSDNFDILQKNITLNNLENIIVPIYSAVVADDILGEDKTINLWKSKNTKVNYRNSIIEKKRGISTSVPAISFNKIIDKNIDGLKIDIEGAEVDILTSNSSKYQNIKKLTFEFTVSSGKIELAQNTLREKDFTINIPPSYLKESNWGWIDYVAHAYRL